ncbi:hypothetical protein RclHR1_03690005 [Rhizophagus clarus]|uniref:Uncharacterized protein n=1 Tax=Rhizophagus clarus TaxID=94130 RepID=A0A2Z6RFY1_9GLOM|nr:hypothetical protein RclHR1_03690005 [Rhizophagus clarus]
MTCPNSVKVSVFFKRNPISNWNNYDDYFSTAKRPSHGSFIRDLVKISNHKDLSSSIRERAREIANFVKNNKNERKRFLDLQAAYEHIRERKRIRVHSSLNVERAVNKMIKNSVAETVSIHTGDEPKDDDEGGEDGEDDEPQEVTMF